MASKNKSENHLVKRNLSTAIARTNEDTEPPESTSLPTTPSGSTMTSAYDWESDKRRSKPTDDGTMSFFWRAHTITWLIVAMSYLFYVAILEEPSESSSYNTKR